MEILLVLVTGALCVACFFVGAKVGQTVAKGEKIEAPDLNPLKAIREARNRREAERKQSINDTIMHNIDNYDGTEANQKDVPRG